jgi:hypothetical protein
MRFNFDFSAAQILWTLTFAAELVLLIVLLGRDRARRFVFFFSSIALSALILLVNRLLFGRMAPIVSSAIFLILSAIVTVIGVLVIVEIARRSFAGASRRAWLIGTAAVLAVAAAVLVFWGVWPAWSTFKDTSLLGILRMLQLFSDKGAVLNSVLGVELGILATLFGRRFGAGWRSHPQQIAIGLSAAGIAQIAARAIWQFIATHTIVHSQAEYDHAMNLRDRIFHANSAVYLCALVWWIVWLWLDEPGKNKDQGTEGPRDLESRDQGNEGTRDQKSRDQETKGTRDQESPGTLVAGTEAGEDAQI